MIMEIYKTKYISKTETELVIALRRRRFTRNSLSFMTLSIGSFQQSNASQLIFKTIERWAFGNVVSHKIKTFCDATSLIKKRFRRMRVELRIRQGYY